MANDTWKNVGLGKFWLDLEISEAFLISLEVSFLHDLFLPSNLGLASLEFYHSPPLKVIFIILHMLIILVLML